MDKTITDTIMMIRPKHFGFNPETAENNTFQSNEGDESKQEVKELAKQEFDRFVSLLEGHGLNIVVMEDKDKPQKPDAVFPNNWISFHQNGSIITYPMFSPIRREERREDIIQEMEKRFGFNRRYSFEYYEEEDLFLEGTGSMILDRTNKIVYACDSDRTDIQILDKWAVLCEYKKILFHAYDREGNPIYHTNVMMALGESFAVVCLDTIQDEEERKIIIRTLEETSKEIIEITLDQVLHFAGNVLHVTNNLESFVVMSTQAFESLDNHQIQALEKHGKILHSGISTIEQNGGGGVRCMMAEVFYPEMSLKL